MIERCHKTLHNMIRSAQIRDKPDLDSLLGFKGVLVACRKAVNSTVHTASRATPAQLVFGRDAMLNATFQADWQFIKEQNLSFKTTSVKTLNASHTRATWAMWQQSKLAKDASMAQIHAWIPRGSHKHMTTALSSSSRSPMTMTEWSLRPGTSGTLNRAWPDHPCVTISQCGKTATARFKSSRAATSVKFQAFCALLNSPADRCHGGECNALICLQHGYAQSVLTWDSFIRDSFAEDTLLIAWD